MDEGLDRWTAIFGQAVRDFDGTFVDYCNRPIVNKSPWVDGSTYATKVASFVDKEGDTYSVAISKHIGGVLTVDAELKRIDEMKQADEEAQRADMEARLSAAGPGLDETQPQPIPSMGIIDEPDMEAHPAPGSTHAPRETD